jgi:spermidine/putrescine ABC transporter ATP-binding subunit
MSTLQLKDVSKKFGAYTAVAGLSVEVQSECLALLGPSGCGKTTTINMIAGFIKPDSGEILVDDSDITGVPPHRRNTGMVFQDYALFPHKTVADNIAFGLRMRGVPKADRTKRVREALDLVDLSSLGDRFPDQISGGQRQRVALARALVIRPSILLLDEPLSNLDARLRESLRDEIRRVLTATQITSVFVTHDQAEAFAVADRVALMNHGRIVQIGTANELYRRPLDRFVAEFFGDCNFLQGRGGTRCDGAISIDTPGGPVRVRTDDASISPDKPELTVAVRPELMFVAASEDQGADVNCLSATVRNIRYLGSTTRYEVALRDSSIVKVDQQQPSDGVAAGHSVFVCWAAAHGVILKAAAAK